MFFQNKLKAFYATSLGQCPGTERLPGGNRGPGVPDALGGGSPSSRHPGASPPARATGLVPAANPAFAPAGGASGPWTEGRTDGRAPPHLGHGEGCPSGPGIQEMLPEWS